jgi:hypothetical protein
VGAAPRHPRIRLAGARREADGGRWRVAATIEQSAPAFTLTLPLTLTTAAGPVRRNVTVDSTHTAVTFQGVARPLSLHIDPDHHVLRRLADPELPATINGLKRIQSVRLVWDAAKARPGVRPAVERLVRSLGLAAAEAGECPAPLAGSDRGCLVVGGGGTHRIPGLGAAAVTVEASRFVVNGHAYPLDRYAFFGVFDDTGSPGRVSALYLPGRRIDPLGIGKATHYGRYSYLVLDGGSVVAKGTWPADHSPVAKTWEAQ